MKYWTFGRTGGQVSDVGYGMREMGDWSGSEDNESLASLQRAIDSSLQFFATLRGSTAWPDFRANSGKKL